MRFKELVNIFYEYCDLDQTKTYTFLALINILLNGDAGNNQRNRFKDLLPDDDDNIPSRFYYQYSSDDDYQVSKFKDVLKRAQPENMVRFINELPDKNKGSIDQAIKTEIRLYRDEVSEENIGGELSVGEGFTRLLMTFIEQRTKKPDLGVSDYFPYDSETKAIIASMKKVGDYNHFNLFVLPKGALFKTGEIRLSRLNAPRTVLCKPEIKITDNNSWVDNFAALKAPSVFLETTAQDCSEAIQNHAFVGFITKEPLQKNYEDVIITYRIIGKVPLQDLIANRDDFGISVVLVNSFFYGKYEGSAKYDYKNCDGYWEPDDSQFCSDTVPSPLEIDEFSMDQIALPMWIIKSVNLSKALELLGIEIQSYE